LDKAGSDALQYLHFQRLLIVYMAFVTLISLSVILPINYTGNKDRGYDEKRFDESTIVNVNPKYAKFKL
jgi:calcium permeable stress-gated cation channel